MCEMSHDLAISGNDKVVAQVIFHQYHTFMALVEFRVYQNYEESIKICPMQLKSNDIIIVNQLPE